MRLIDADAFAKYIRKAIKTQKYDKLKVDDITLTVGEVLESVIAELEGTSIDGFKNNPTIEPQPKKKLLFSECLKLIDDYKDWVLLKNAKDCAESFLTYLIIEGYIDG